MNAAIAPTATIAIMTVFPIRQRLPDMTGIIAEFALPLKYSVIRTAVPLYNGANALVCPFPFLRRPRDLRRGGFRARYPAGTGEALFPVPRPAGTGRRPPARPARSDPEGRRCRTGDRSRFPSDQQ